MWIVGSVVSVYHGGVLGVNQDVTVETFQR
jgi:hypothetical protein